LRWKELRLASSTKKAVENRDSWQTWFCLTLA
jgi:hypothetical protein